MKNKRLGTLGISIFELPDANCGLLISCKQGDDPATLVSCTPANAGRTVQQLVDQMMAGLLAATTTETVLVSVATPKTDKSLFSEEW